MPRSAKTVLLAALQNGEHVQIGKAYATYDDAYQAWETMDSSLTGWHRDERQNVKRGSGSFHAIQGQPVKFYRLRDVGGGTPDNVTAEFGPVARVRGGSIRTNGVRRTGFIGLKRGR